MGDGTGAVMLDGKMEDDASVKQCQVMVELATQLAAATPSWPRLRPLTSTRSRSVVTYEHDAPERSMPRPMMTLRPRRSVLYMPGANERALEKAKGIPADALILDLEDAVAPDAKAEARDRVLRRGRARASTAPRRSPSGSTGSTPRGTTTTSRRHRRGRARRRRGARRSTPPPTWPRSRRRLEAAGAPDHTRHLGHARDPGRHAARRGDRRRLRAARRAGDGHQRPGQGAARRARARPASRCCSGLQACLLAARAPARSSSTASTTTSRTTTASWPSACRAASSASTARPSSTRARSSPATTCSPPSEDEIERRPRDHRRLRGGPGRGHGASSPSTAA